MKETIKEILITRGGDPTLKLSEDKPAVIMFVGVNGGGKTTSIGKLAHRFSSQGRESVCVRERDAHTHTNTHTYTCLCVCVCVCVCV
jgi:signal recognition particle GTPase